MGPTASRTHAMSTGGGEPGRTGTHPPSSRPWSTRSAQASRRGTYAVREWGWGSWVRRSSEQRRSRRVVSAQLVPVLRALLQTSQELLVGPTRPVVLHPGRRRPPSRRTRGVASIVRSFPVRRPSPARPVFIRRRPFDGSTAAVPCPVEPCSGAARTVPGRAGNHRGGTESKGHTERTPWTDGTIRGVGREVNGYGYSL
jgi:hypothetical protein